MGTPDDEAGQEAAEEDSDVISLSVPIELDDHGYWDRRCPSDECGFSFKIHYEDFQEKVPDEGARCPFCGHAAGAYDFNTPEQAAYLEQVAVAQVLGTLTEQLREIAARFNRGQPRSGFITMRMDVSAPERTVSLPPRAAEAMTLRIACQACECRFSVIGAAYFCPACGHNSAPATFAQSLAAARNALAALPQITAAVADPDASAQVRRGIIEANLGTLVMAFQRWAEAEYPHLPAAAPKIRRNAFQSLDEGSTLWEAAGGTAYGRILAATELDDLRRLFQQRHLIAHRDGLVDQDYLDRSGDTTYRVGQRVVIREAAILRLAELLERLVAGLCRDLP